MSGWDAWAEQLTKDRACHHGAIVARDGSSVWGKSGSFSLSEYPKVLEDGAGGKKTVAIDEGLLMVQNINAQGIPTKEMQENGALFINRIKYRVTRYLDDIDACYLTGEGQWGGAMQRTTHAIVFGAYSKLEG